MSALLKMDSRYPGFLFFQDPNQDFFQISVPGTTRSKNKRPEWSQTAFLVHVSQNITLVMFISNYNSKITNILLNFDTETDPSEEIEPNQEISSSCYKASMH